ncbi:PQQ-binding-like beta-propeller repeat protein [Flavobacterium zhairuonense]|uniref:outer membrane protein assembly factor BamB family protein n=1 Tax=Flavobacterium zhairuonense TaxID=2493631 RepID=UPI00104771A6|nr:PQQ-binding-like beta-propeller repeat protein [Flavobacterium zhairuonense]KAF2511445.1 PQQ-binding-like beta-propeller repeat protein [Flavobacterium zhairuonense]
MAKNSEDWQETRKIYLAVSTLCFLLGTFFFIRVITGSYIIQLSDLVVCENLITSEGAKFKETKGKHSQKWIEFKCIDNKSTFKIIDYDYRCVVDDDILNAIKAGDTISLSILKSDIDDFDNDTACEIHSLVKNGKEYLDFNCRNKEDNGDGERAFILLFAITIMTGIVFLFAKKPKFFDHVNPKFIIWIVIIVLFFATLSGCQNNKFDYDPSLPYPELKVGERWDDKYDNRGLQNGIVKGDFLYVNTINISEGKEFLYCLNLETKKVTWKNEVDLYASQPVCISQNRIYYVSYVGSIYCFSAVGKKLWSLKPDVYHMADQLKTVNDNLVLTNANHEVFEFDKNSGKIVTQYVITE